MAENIIEDESNDDKYFVLTPRVVWALCGDPYEYTFWCIVKDIAGKKRQCIISTPDLATLTMMSTGKAQQVRASLIEKGLLKGRIVKDPGYPQAVWHLSIPDLWKVNVEWSERFLAIRDRIEYKSKQASDRKELSCGESSKELSCGEKGPSPHEKGPSPHERKNSIKEENKEKENTQADKIWLKFFSQLEQEMLHGSPADRMFFERWLSRLRFAARSNGTLLLYAENAEDAAYLQERAGKLLENRCNGYPELAGVKIQFVTAE